MRILQLNHRFEEIGGAEVYFRSLARWQRERGHEVALFAASPERAVDEPDTLVVERPSFDLKRLLEDPDLDGRLARFAQAFRPDLVHVHNLYSFPAGFVLALAALEVPIVQTVHDLSIVCTNGWCVLPDGEVCEGGPGRKCLERGCESNAPYDARLVQTAAFRLALLRTSIAAFVSPSEFVADRCRRSRLGPVEVVPYYVDPALFPEEEAQARDSKRLLFAGRLSREKGVHTLIEALRTVVDRDPAATLTVLGDGDQLAALRARVAELGLEKSVSFRGARPRAEVLSELRRCAALVLPSEWCENSPVSIYESLLAGLPVVATRMGGIPELVRDGVTGLLAEPRSADSLAERLLTLLGDEALQAKLSGNAKEHAHRYSDLEAHLARLESVYADARAGSTGATSADWADLLACSQLVQTRYAEFEDWAGFGGRPRRMLGKLAGGLFGAPRKPAGGRP